MLLDEGIHQDSGYWIKGFELYPCIYVMPSSACFTNQNLDYCSTSGANQYDANIFTSPIHPFVTFLKAEIEGFTKQHEDFKRIASETENDAMKLYYSSLGSGVWDRRCDAVRVLGEFYKCFPEFKIDAAEATGAI